MANFEAHERETLEEKKRLEASTKALEDKMEGMTKDIEQARGENMKLKQDLKDSRR